MKNPYYYIGANPTCDLIIINPENKILLIKRSENAVACPSQWALPGGFIDTESKPHTTWQPGKETPEEAALRELKEETNLELSKEQVIHPVGIYEGNQRDPRDNEISWSKSHAFLAFIDENTYLTQKDKIIGLDDAEDADWKTIEEIKKMNLAFDHLKIITDGLNQYFFNNKKSFNKII